MPVQSIDSFDVHSCTNLSQVGSLGVHSKSKKRKPLHCTSKVGFRTLVRPGKASSMLLCRDVMHPCVFWTSSAQVVPSVKDDFYIYIYFYCFLPFRMFVFLHRRNQVVSRCFRGRSSRSDLHSSMVQMNTGRG